MDEPISAEAGALVITDQVPVTPTISHAFRHYDNDRSRRTSGCERLAIAPHVEGPGLELPVSYADSSGESVIESDLMATAPQDVKTVLCVEDNQANVTLIEHIITRRPGVRLMVAMRGQAAIDLAIEQRPDLILLDLGLPDMPGDEVLRQLQADPRTAAIPVVVISGDAMPQRSRELLAMGASTFLTKPYDMQQFLGIIDDTLASAPSAHDDS